MLDQTGNQAQHHPTGLWCLSATYGIFFSSYISLVSLLVLYLVDVFHFSSAQAYNLFGSFNALIWSCPLLGGYLAEKFGYKPVAAVGFALSMIGLIICSIPNTSILYLGLGAFIIGYGFATPACFSMIGLMYRRQDSRRDSGFTLFYLIFNVGGLISITLAGYLVRYLGYHVTLMIEALIIIFSLVMFALVNRWVQPSVPQTMNAELKLSLPKNLLVIICAAIIAVPVVAFLLKFSVINQVIIWLLFAAAIIAILRLAYKQTENTAKYKLYALLFLLILSMLFWALYFLEPSLLTIFVEKNVDRHIGHFVIPPSTYYGLDAFFVIIFGYFLSRLWWYLAHRKRDVSIPAKFTIAMFSIALGYLSLVLGLSLIEHHPQLLNMWWIVLCYFFIAIGELLVGPISFAMVGRLSPPGKDGGLMGIQQLFMGSGAMLSGYLAQLAVTPSAGTPAITNPIYTQAYLLMGAGTLVVAIIAMVVIKPIRQLIGSES